MEWVGLGGIGGVRRQIVVQSVSGVAHALVKLAIG